MSIPSIVNTSQSTDHLQTASGGFQKGKSTVSALLHVTHEWFQLQQMLVRCFLISIRRLIWSPICPWCPNLRNSTWIIMFLFGSTTTLQTDTKYILLWYHHSNAEKVATEVCKVASCIRVS